tara:strand:+ start:346 stop:579 length:234 start_codon:yes stop_codon:yes gene_type:complete
MPQIGWFELLVVVIIAIIVIGPKDFPVVLNKLGSWFSSIKNYFSEVQNNLNKVTNLEINDEDKKKDSIDKNNNEQKK